MYFTDLGYDNYDEYLQGKEWKEIKDSYYGLKTPYRCGICHAGKQLILHKRSYVALTMDFWRKHPKLFKRAMGYFCHRCNGLIHFYNKQSRVPLDYLTLYDRERQIYWRPRFIFLRIVRTINRTMRWFYFSYRTGGKDKRRIR